MRLIVFNFFVFRESMAPMFNSQFLNDHDDVQTRKDCKTNQSCKLICLFLAFHRRIPGINSNSVPSSCLVENAEKTTNTGTKKTQFLFYFKLSFYCFCLHSKSSSQGLLRVLPLCVKSRRDGFLL